MKIAEAAAAIGVEAHVLRHWEDVGVLVPMRTSGGHRTYDANQLDDARMIRACQRAGMSLADIRELGGRSPRQMAAVVENHRDNVRIQVAHLQRTERFLEHVLTCTHRIVAECPECSEFVTP